MMLLHLFKESQIEMKKRRGAVSLFKQLQFKDGRFRAYRTQGDNRHKYP